MAQKPKLKSDAIMSKHDVLIKILHGKRGSTLAQMQKVSGWQTQSIRGFLSGIVKKKLGLKLVSEEGAGGGRRYFIAKN